MRDERSFLAVVVGDALGSTVAPWAEHQERLILRTGRLLSPPECALAAELGVAHPERVRILHVEPVPLPVPQAWIAIARRLGLPVFAPGGMTLGYGVFATVESPDLIRHELVHVAQFERLGGIAPFLRLYFFECLSVGYQHAPLEVEARRLGF